MSGVCVRAHYVCACMRSKQAKVYESSSPLLSGAHSKALHLSARGVTTDTLVQIQAVSQQAVIGSPIGW
jgi:hypothetical protein